jgi:hypothetical protein
MVAPLLFISGCNSTNMGAQSLELPQTRSASVAAARTTGAAQTGPSAGERRRQGAARRSPCSPPTVGAPAFLLHGTGRRVTRSGRSRRPDGLDDGLQAHG